MDTNDTTMSDSMGANRPDASSLLVSFSDINTILSLIKSKYTKHVQLPRHNYAIGLYFCFALAFILSLAPITYFESSSAEGQLVGAGFFLGFITFMLLAMGRQSNLGTLVPVSPTSEFEQWQAILLTLRTDEALACAQMATRCVESARRTSGRKQRKHLRLVARYCYCPVAIRIIGRLALVRDLSDTETPAGEIKAPSAGSSLSSIMFSGSGNAFSSAWYLLHELVAIASRDSGNLDLLRRICRYWSSALYYIERYEREGKPSDIICARTLCDAMVAECANVSQVVVKPRRVKSEWMLFAFLTFIAWSILTALIVFLGFDKVGPTLVAGVFGTCALLYTTWNLSISRDRVWKETVVAKLTHVRDLVN